MEYWVSKAEIIFILIPEIPVYRKKISSYLTHYSNIPVCQHSIAF